MLNIDSICIVDSDGNKRWTKDGKLEGEKHRIDGAALELINGNKYWFYHNKFIGVNNQEDFERMIKGSDKKIKNNIFESYYLAVDKGFDESADWITTYSGIRFCPTVPNISAICIKDIARSLSMQCRFAGHLSEFYSVAQHSVLVSMNCNSEDTLWGLLHDASEAYLVDIPTPLKRSKEFEGYRILEKNMMKCICNRFGLDEVEPKSIGKADKILLSTEARDLLDGIREDWVNLEIPLDEKIIPLGPKEAEQLFINRFKELI